MKGKHWITFLCTLAIASSTVASAERYRAYKGKALHRNEIAICECVRLDLSLNESNGIGPRYPVSYELSVDSIDGTPVPNDFWGPHPGLFKKRLKYTEIEFLPGEHSLRFIGTQSFTITFKFEAGENYKLRPRFGQPSGSIVPPGRVMYSQALDGFEIVRVGRQIPGFRE